MAAWPRGVFGNAYDDVRECISTCARAPAARCAQQRHARRPKGHAFPRRARRRRRRRRRPLGYAFRNVAHPRRRRPARRREVRRAPAHSDVHMTASANAYRHTAEPAGPRRGPRRRADRPLRPPPPARQTGTPRRTCIRIRIRPRAGMHIDICISTRARTAAARARGAGRPRRARARAGTRTRTCAWGVRIYRMGRPYGKP